MKMLFEDLFDKKIDVENQYLQRLRNTLNYDRERYTSKFPFIKNPELLPDNYILTEYRTDNSLKIYGNILNYLKNTIELFLTILKRRF